MVKLLTKEVFAPRLKTLRKRAKLTQTDLANALGVQTATISRWEGGIMLPSDDKFAEICAYFQKDYDFFTQEISPSAAEGMQIYESMLHELRELTAGKRKSPGEPAIDRSEALIHFMTRTARLEQENKELLDRIQELKSSPRRQIPDLSHLGRDFLARLAAADEDELADIRMVFQAHDEEKRREESESDEESG